MSVGENENTNATAALRAELKKWENVFREANGRKPARADIKADATIAAKYKLFDRLAGRKAAQPPPPPPPAATPKKSTRHAEPKPRTENIVSSTPRKTPSKAHKPAPKPSVLSPIQEQQAEPTPAFIRNALGPTPQKDGQVLGIFDIDTGPTPSKVEDATSTNMVAGTPCKAPAPSSDAAFSKTPQSSSKRFFLDAFAGTPLKRKREKEDDGITSSSKRQFATPAFLRRSFPMAAIDEEGADTTTTSRQPFARRGLVRSLSSIMNNLKKQEEERMDEEWDVLNEIEQEEQQPKKAKAAENVLVEDSQPVEMPLGPDQAPVSEGEDSNAEGEEKNRKPWKKKGLKRQTRRVIMRPVLHKAKKAEEDIEEEEEEAVPETQLQNNAADGSDFEDESAEKESTTQKSKEKKARSNPKEGEKMKVRKVNPDAHANFRKLKIKNKNSKATGRGRKFGRR